MRANMRKLKPKIIRKAKTFKLSDTTLLAEPALAKDWNRPEEAKAWTQLRTDKRDFLASARSLRERMPRMFITDKDLRAARNKGRP